MLGKVDFWNNFREEPGIYSPYIRVGAKVAKGIIIKELGYEYKNVILIAKYIRSRRLYKLFFIFFFLNFHFINHNKFKIFTKKNVH